MNSLTVITQSEAGAALGQTVKPAVKGHATVEGDVAAVLLRSSGPSRANPNIPVDDSVRVVLVTRPNALKYFNDYRSKVKAQPIAGLGDRAYYDGYASLQRAQGRRVSAGRGRPRAQSSPRQGEAGRRRTAPDVSPTQRRQSYAGSSMSRRAVGAGWWLSARAADAG